MRLPLGRLLFYDTLIRVRRDPTKLYGFKIFSVLYLILIKHSHTHTVQDMVSKNMIFKLNPSSISQQWIENKFYSFDEKNMHLFRAVNRFCKESAQLSHSQRPQKLSTQTTKEFPSPASNKFSKMQILV